jgi:mannose-6-phosphate isomerase
VYLGFSKAVEPDHLLAIVEAGDGASLLPRLNEITVAPGDTIFVPAGTPHAIGEGILLVEVQEPSDLIVRLEWSGYVVGGLPNDLDLGLPVALTAVDTSAWTPARVAEAIRHSNAASSAPVQNLLPSSADPFFRMELVTVAGSAELDAGYAILVCLEGAVDVIVSDGPPSRLSSGMTALVPDSCGRILVSGSGALVRCRPAVPKVAGAADPDLATTIAGTIFSRVDQPR